MVIIRAVLLLLVCLFCTLSYSHKYYIEIKLYLLASHGGVIYSTEIGKYHTSGLSIYCFVDCAMEKRWKKCEKCKLKLYHFCTFYIVNKLNKYSSSHQKLLFYLGEKSFMSLMNEWSFNMFLIFHFPFTHLLKWKYQSVFISNYTHLSIATRSWW